MMGAAYPIGFIRLGTMGEAVALTLVKAGTRLLVWNSPATQTPSLTLARGWPQCAGRRCSAGRHRTLF
jgi:3-hydroxyisobutyrate dehydrogenase-like beta-hydroxyacid dehydrogenase